MSSKLSRRHRATSCESGVDPMASPTPKLQPFSDSSSASSDPKSWETLDLDNLSSRNVFSRFVNRCHVRYEVETAIYMLNSYEKTIFNIGVVSMLSLGMYA